MEDVQRNCKKKRGCVGKAIIFAPPPPKPRLWKVQSQNSLEHTLFSLSFITERKLGFRLKIIKLSSLLTFQIINS